MLQRYSASGAFSYLDDCSLTTLEYDCKYTSHIYMAIPFTVMLSLLANICLKVSRP